jgi:hypothetical protein
MQWMIAQDGREIGPYGTDEVHGWIRDRRINAETPVRAVDSAEWSTIGAVSALSAGASAGGPVVGPVAAGGRVASAHGPRPSAVDGRRWAGAIVGALLGALLVTGYFVYEKRRTDPGVVACLDARLRASDGWRTFAAAADQGATAQEGALNAAEQALLAAQGTTDYAAQNLARAAQREASASAQRFRARATQSSEMVARLGNPYLEVVAGRRWGSNPSDPGSSELVLAQQASEAAWGLCRVYCYDIHCSGIAPALGSRRDPAAQP